MQRGLSGYQVIRISGITILLLLSACSKPAKYTKDLLLMDTFVHIKVNDALDGDLKARAIDKTIARMKELEKRFDYFSEDSELSKLNSGEEISLSPEMSKVLEKSEDLRKITGGAFDIRVGHDKKLDLGGIAKGFIVDEGIKILKESGIKNALINAGGDMYCMWQNFKVGIKDPRNTGKIIATFNVKNKGVATSASYERPSHIIDPRTGKPVEKRFKSITVVANNCMTADGLATALYVLSPQEGLSLIESINDAECFIIDDGETHISEGFPQIALTNS